MTDGKNYQMKSLFDLSLRNNKTMNTVNIREIMIVFPQEQKEPTKPYPGNHVAPDFLSTGGKRQG